MKYFVIQVDNQYVYLDLPWGQPCLGDIRDAKVWTNLID